MLRAVGSAAGSGGVGGIGPPPALMVPVVILATANETRVSTITPTNSTQLVYNVPVAGSYMFDCIVPMQQAAAGTVGMSGNMNYSGTVVNSAVDYDYQNQSIGPGQVIAATVAQVQYAISPLNTFAEPVLSRGWMQVSTTGTLAFAFSQNTSSTTVVTLVGNQANLPAILIVWRIA